MKSYLTIPLFPLPTEFERENVNAVANHLRARGRLSPMPLESPLSLLTKAITRLV